MGRFERLQLEAHARAIGNATEHVACPPASPVGEERAVMYLHLFHGRHTVSEETEGWGYDGPVLRIFGFHTTYMGHMRIGVSYPSADWEDLHFVRDLLYYNGRYYGDFSIFAPSLSEIKLIARAEDVHVNRLRPEVKDATEEDSEN